MDFNELQKNWQKIGHDVPGKEVFVMHNRLTLSERLRRRYRRIGVIGLIFPILGLSMYRQLDVSATLCVMYSIYGVLMGLLSLKLERGLRDSSYLTLPVISAARHIMRLNRMRIRNRRLGIILMVPILAALLYEFWKTDIYAFTGGCVGAVFGLIIGICLDIRNKRDFEALYSTFVEAGKDDCD